MTLRLAVWLTLLISTSAYASVPYSRLQILSRGANISTMFEAGTDLYNDLGAVSADGFKHVRVFVLLESLDDPDYLQRLDRLIAETNQLRLGIVLCMISRTHEWRDDSDVERLWVAGWTLLAERYRASSPDYVFLELANEPHIHDAHRWESAQEHLRQVVRGVMPQHTILLTGSPLSTVWSLPEHVAKDDDVVYSFHLYQPMIITHQGADWLPSLRPYLGLVYPPDAANISRMTNANTAEKLASYKKDGLLTIKHEIDRAIAWRTDKHVPVVCDEFGVYDRAPPATRAAWLGEARNRLEAAKIGWTIWEYKGGFGVSPLFPHAPITQALGLDR